ncbi:hypothetical protein ACIA5D_47610 [Actinoplanes sp. NPDC051513]|uniref:hypothetical protein n=1 Tax=Actinoplanes sp. NPDC051513 TaxID=3363908 RepID=UPI0037A745B2
MSDLPTVELVEQLRRTDAGLREVLTAREAEITELRAMMHALGLQVAELQRRPVRALFRPADICCVPIYDAPRLRWGMIWRKDTENSLIYAIAQGVRDLATFYEP